MLRALAWKEWREQRPVVIGGIAFGIVVPLFVAVSGDLQNVPPAQIVEAIPLALLGVVWPLLAAAAGAMTIAHEDEGKTLAFLLSRPVSRRRLWAVKVAMAMFAVVASAAFSLLVIRLAAGVTPGAPDLAATMSHELVATLRPVGLGSLSVLLFACSVFCSTFLKRSLTAASAALAMTLALLAGVLLVWGRLALVPRLEPQWFATEIVVLAAGVLLVSLIVFARGELFAGDGHRLQSGSGGPVVFGALALIVVVAGALPGVYAAANIDTADVVIDADSVDINGAYLVMTVTTRDGGASQIRTLASDGSGLRPLTARYTTAPAAAGRYVLYRSRRGIAGTRGGGVDLRLADPGGVIDRLVLRDVPLDVPLFLNRPSSGYGFNEPRVMFLDGDSLTVASLDGAYHEVVDVGGTPLRGGTVLGFNDEEGDEVLYLERVAPLAAGGHAATNLGVVRLADGAVRVLHRLPEGWRMPALSRRDGTSVPTLSTTRYPMAAVLVIANDRIDVVDTVAGDLETIHEFEVGDDPESRRAFGRCATAFGAARRTWLSDEGRSYRESQVLFADCTAAARAEAAHRNGAESPAAGLVRLRGRDSGDERTWVLPAFEGTVNRLWLTRRQGRVLVDIRGDTEATSYAMLLSLDGPPTVYPSGWIPRGPLRVDRFLFQGTRDGDVAFATVDVVRAPDRLRPLYPAAEEEIR